MSTLMIVSIYCCYCMDETFVGVMDVTMTFPLFWEKTRQKIPSLEDEFAANDDMWGYLGYLI